MRDFWTPPRFLSAIVALLLVSGASRVASAVNYTWIGPNDGDWIVPLNWDQNTFPDSCCDEVAIINNSTTAVISTSGFDANGLILGQAAANVGGLRIANGGSLIVEPFGGGASGAISVGQSGQGNLTILGGGTLTGASLALGGTTASSIALGDTSTLTATLTTSGAATLNRTTHVTGQFVNFNSTGNLTLGAAHTLIGNINHASLHSPLKSDATAFLNGTFKVQFDNVTPTAGNTWTIIDAAAISGSFAALDTSAAPALPTGQAYQLTRATNAGRQQVQLSVEQLLTLRVHRGTGEVSIRNTGSTPVTFDGYSVLSSLGALTGTWNRLQTQGDPGWVITDNTVKDRSELNPLGSLTLNGGQFRSLGELYEPIFPAFGVDPDHLAFEYSTPPPNGQSVVGFVEYEGPKVHNNLILSINPNTGMAQLKNDSPYTIEIDGYSIYSDVGALQPQNGKWFSLEDRGVTGWEEAFSDASSVNELNADAPLTLLPFTGYDLGELYDETIGGIVNPDPSMRIEFLMTSNQLPVDGVVAFGAFGPVDPPGVEGDLNGDEVVDMLDYVFWRKHELPPEKYDEWSGNFGGPAGSGGSAAVPEPVSAILLLVAAGVLACYRQGLR